MFRDRVVSMEQTLEGGEKNLELLKSLCRDALPEYVYREHILDHERDLFVMVLEGPDGRIKRVSWTRMVLYDADRIPVLTGDPSASLRAKIVEFLRARSAHPEVVVTFRHLEEGWKDSPEPRREKKRRRGRGERGRREGRHEAAPSPSAFRTAGPASAPPPPPSRRPGPPLPPSATSPEAERPGGGRRRRRFRRRRRGRGPGGSVPPGGPPAR